MLGFLVGHFFGSQHSPHDRAIHLVGGVDDLPIVLHLADGESRQVAFLVEHLMASCHRKVAFYVALAIGGLVTVLVTIAGEDANLVVVVRQPVFGLIQQYEVLRLVFLLVVDGLLHRVQNEVAHDALPFGVLCDIERNIKVDHAQQHPSDPSGGVAHQVPVFHDGLGRLRFLRLVRTGIDARLCSRGRCGCRRR